MGNAPSAEEFGSTVADALDPNKNGAKEAFDPSKNGFNETIKGAKQDGINGLNSIKDNVKDTVKDTVKTVTDIFGNPLLIVGGVVLLIIVMK